MSILLDIKYNFKHNILMYPKLKSETFHIQYTIYICFNQFYCSFSHFYGPKAIKKEKAMPLHFYIFFHQIIANTNLYPHGFRPYEGCCVFTTQRKTN